MKSKVLAHWGLYLLFFVIFVFNFKVIFGGVMPAPLDGMIGLYHPFRDLYSQEFPNGIPFKNFLLTDPFRQSIVWKNLSIEVLKNGNLPLWNPYEMAGKPLLGNFQAGAFYPLNLLFILLPFKFAWSFYIVLAQIIGGVGMYYYLSYLKKSEYVKTLGSIVFIFSGFFIAWYEWGTIVHAFAWFPLALLICERISAIKKLNLKKLTLLGLMLGLVFSVSFLAGHPQTTLYFIIFTSLYLMMVVNVKIVGKLVFYFSSFSAFLLLSFVQMYQGIQFVRFSLRGEDQIYSSIEGWFVPYQNILQFFAPDFFGNPSTLNYWGVFNYAEFIGYIGVPFLVLSLFALFANKDRRFYFALSLVVVCGVLITKNFLSEIPYKLEIPIISSMQPTRMIGFMSFGLIMLGIYGLDVIQSKLSLKKYLLTLIPLMGIVFMIWIMVIINPFHIDTSDLLTSKRNLILPTGIFIISIMFLIANYIFGGKQKYSTLKKGLMIFLAVVIVFDLLRFSNKFTPFSEGEFFYPSTPSIEFIQKNVGQHRVLSLDDRILAPNITTYYKIQNLGGYDPLYLKNFAELIAASERGSTDISLPYGFNRIISPKNIDSDIIDLLGVKYVLSIGEITSEKFNLVVTEGLTKVYENKNVYDRAFFVEEIRTARSKEEALEMVFDSDLKRTAIILNSTLQSAPNSKMSIGEVRSFELTDEGVRLRVENKGDGFLVVTDSYYPMMRAYIDGVATIIYETDYALRGVIVPEGSHVVEFKSTLF